MNLSISSSLSSFGFVYSFKTLRLDQPSLRLTGTKYFDLQAFRLRGEKSYIIRLVNSELVVKAVFSSIVYLSYQAPAREKMRNFIILGNFCAAGSQLRVH